jgi:PAS domain-containing protein
MLFARKRQHFSLDESALRCVVPATSDRIQSHSHVKTTMQIELRQTAEERIQKGTAPVTRGLPIGAQALTLLHGLASAPETAGDALKLLHELQVHQVELDLQYEQTEQDHQQLDEDLRRYVALFDHAPFAYVTVDHDGLLLAANRVAADWFAPDEANESAGHRIEEMLAPECRSAIRDVLAKLRGGAGRQSCMVRSRAGGGSARAVASAAPDGQVLLAFVPSETEPAN